MSEVAHNQHLALAERARTELSTCMKKAKDDDSYECLSFDLEKRFRYQEYQRT